MIEKVLSSCSSAFSFSYTSTYEPIYQGCGSTGNSWSISMNSNWWSISGGSDQTRTITANLPINLSDGSYDSTISQSHYYLWEVRNWKGSCSNKKDSTRSGSDVLRLKFYNVTCVENCVEDNYCLLESDTLRYNYITDQNFVSGSDERTPTLEPLKNSSSWKINCYSEMYCHIQNSCTNYYLASFGNGVTSQYSDSGDNALWFIARNLDGTFDLINKLDGRYLALNSNSKTLKLSFKSNDSLFNIQGSKCDFLQSQQYKKFNTLETLDAYPKCPTKAVVRSVQLVGEPISDTKDNVNLQIHCDGQLWGNVDATFSIGNNYAYFDNFSAECDETSIDFVLSITSAGKGYTVIIPQSQYTSYLDNTVMSIDISKVQINEGAIIFDASANASIDAGSSGQASAEALFGLFGADVSYSARAWANAMANFSIMVPKICITTSMSADSDVNVSSEALGQLLLFNALSIVSAEAMANFRSNFSANIDGEICTKIDEYTKYKIEFILYSINRHNCWTESDRLSLSSGALTIKSVSPKIDIELTDALQLRDMHYLFQREYVLENDSLFSGWNCEGIKVPCVDSFSISINNYNTISDECYAKSTYTIGYYDIEIDYTANDSLFNILTSPAMCNQIFDDEQHEAGGQEAGGFAIKEFIGGVIVGVFSSSISTWLICKHIVDCYKNTPSIVIVMDNTDDSDQDITSCMSGNCNLKINVVESLPTPEDTNTTTTTNHTLQQSQSDFAWGEFLVGTAIGALVGWKVTYSVCNNMQCRTSDNTEVIIVGDQEDTVFNDVDYYLM